MDSTGSWPQFLAGKCTKFLTWVYACHVICIIDWSRFVVAPAVSLDHGVDDDVSEVAGAWLARDARHLGLVLHDEAPLDRQHVQNLISWQI